jgi:hypothetical protein
MYECGERIGDNTDRWQNLRTKYTTLVEAGHLSLWRCRLAMMDSSYTSGGIFR